MSPKTKTVLNTGMTKEEIVKTPEKKGSKAHASAVPESRKRAHDGFLEFTPDRPTKALRSPMAPERIPAQTQTSLESSPSDSENILLSGLKNLKLKSYLDLKMRMKEKKKTHTWKTTRRSTLETLPLSTNLLFYMEYLFDEKTWLER